MTFTDEASDVDIETITDTAWSVEMPGHSIKNISSANALISVERLVGFRTIRTKNAIPIPFPRLSTFKKMPSRKSEQVNVSQAESLKSQTENSAARCFVILGQAPKLPSEKNVTKAESQPKHTEVLNRMRCDISAATSATTTVRSTQPARRTYIRNPAVRAVYKEGSYQHYLHRRITRLISTIAACAHSIDREIRSFNFVVDSYISDFDLEFTLMKSKVGSDDYESQLKLLSDKIKSCRKDTIQKSSVINATLKSYANELEKKIIRLNYKIAPFAQDLEMQILLTNSKINSYDDDICRNNGATFSKYDQFVQYVKTEFGKFPSETVFA